MMISHPVRRILATLLFSASACALVVPGTPLPLLIAHRGGTADAPENTLEAIRSALVHHANGIWLSVQLSRDHIPVLYRPQDLSALTDGRGRVADRTLAELERLNAGWQFKRASPESTVAYPYRDRPVRIPTLAQALAAIPPDIPIFLDMKSLPANALADAVAKTLSQHDAWPRVTLYSTDAEFQALFARFPQARLFESRDRTRTRLLNVALADRCHPTPEPGHWVAFEYERPLEITEKFTLGEGHSQVGAKLWTPAALRCQESLEKVPTLIIGINDREHYLQAACLGADAVLVDSPAKMDAIRASLRPPFDCPQAVNEPDKTTVPDTNRASDRPRRNTP